MKKIIQISVDVYGNDGDIKSDIIGLSDDGKLYYWGSKRKDGKEGYDINAEMIYGWILMEDKINV